MANIDDIADYIIESLLSDGDFEELSNQKLQKLLFYAEAWSQPILQKSLIDDFADFEAWNHGPINVHIYNRFKQTKSLYSLITLNDIINPKLSLEKEITTYIDYILTNYAKLSSMQLEMLCHGEEPWIKARIRVTNGDSSKIISKESINQYYGNRWKLLRS